MAVTKYPLIRYKVLDSCFRSTRKKYYIEDLLDKCNQALEEVTGEPDSIKLRQLRDDIAFMRSPEGWNIELAELYDGKKRIYRYQDPSFSIMHLPLSAAIMEEFKSSVEVLSQFEGMPQFDWLQESLAKMNMEVNRHESPIISFDSNPYLKGAEHLAALYHAIKNKTVLNITYQDFMATEPYPVTLHPYHLKQYNNRWFLFGLNEINQIPTWNLAIDRIVNVTESSATYIDNTTIDWNDYFEDIIGVTKPPDCEPTDITLHFYGITGKYVENKPIHGSQKSRWLDTDTMEVRLCIIPNYELERLILSYGESVKVVGPEKLRNFILKRMHMVINSYEIKIMDITKYIGII